MIARKSLFHLKLVMMFLVLCGISTMPAAAQSYAEVGFAYPDGTVQLDESRFTQSISTTPETEEPLGDSVLGISNGLLKLIRIGEDQCTSEEIQLYIHDTSKGTLDPITSSLNSEWYPNGSNFGLPSHPGPVYVVEAQPAPFLYRCVDDGCFQSKGGYCAKVGDPNPPCACTWVEGVELQMGFGGCRQQVDLRSWWSLSLSVLSAFIESP